MILLERANPVLPEIIAPANTIIIQHQPQRPQDVSLFSFFHVPSCEVNPIASRRIVRRSIDRPTDFGPPLFKRCGWCGVVEVLKMAGGGRRTVHHFAFTLVLTDFDFIFLGCVFVLA